jgi:hypothetical protein
MDVDGAAWHARIVARSAVRRPDGQFTAAGCTTVAPSQGYRAPGSTAAPWQIRGELFDFTNVKIFVNDTKVIDKRVSLVSGDGEFRGSYGGKAITASCSTSAGLLTAGTRCIVFVDNERAATLSF